MNDHTDEKGVVYWTVLSTVTRQEDLVDRKDEMNNGVTAVNDATIVTRDGGALNTGEMVVAEITAGQRNEDMFPVVEPHRIGQVGDQPAEERLGGLGGGGEAPEATCLDAAHNLAGANHGKGADAVSLEVAGENHWWERREGALVRRARTPTAGMTRPAKAHLGLHGEERGKGATGGKPQGVPSRRRHRRDGPGGQGTLRGVKVEDVVVKRTHPWEQTDAPIATRQGDLRLELHHQPLADLREERTKGRPHRKVVLVNNVPKKRAGRTGEAGLATGACNQRGNAGVATLAGETQKKGVKHQTSTTGASRPKALTEARAEAHASEVVSGGVGVIAGSTLLNQQLGHAVQTGIP